MSERSFSQMLVHPLAESSNCKSSNFAKFPMELHAMITERCQAIDLRNVARVQTSWRSYVANNMQKMRQAYVFGVKLMTNEDGLNEIVIQTWDGDLKPLHNIDEIIKYRSHALYQSLGGVEDLSSFIENLPHWWMNQIEEVGINLRSALFGILLHRFPHLETVTVIVEDERKLRDFIRVAPGIKFWRITCVDVDLLDETLKTFIAKSQSHPLEFPITEGEEECSFYSVGQIILFIQNNQFTEKEVHNINIRGHLEGFPGDMQEWIEANTTNSIIRTSFFDGDQSFDYKFDFRGMKFEMHVHAYIDHWGDTSSDDREDSDVSD